MTTEALHGTYSGVCLVKPCPIHDIIPTLDIDNIMWAIEAYASPDEWNVPSIYTSTVRGVLVAINYGVPAEDIVAHSEHIASDCTTACKPVERFMNLYKEA